MNRLQKISNEKKYEFLISCLNRDEFLKFLRGFEFFDKDYKIKFNPSFKLSGNEFQYIPLNYYEELYKNLKIDEIKAGEFNTWFYVNYEAVKNGVIEPYYFGFLENQKDALKNITKALREYKKGNKKFFEKVFRAVLRRMFGAVKERGRKGVFQDVPFSIAWWKYHIYLQSGKEEVLKFLYERDSFYKELVLKMGFTLTLLAERELLKALLEYGADEYFHSGKIPKKIIEKVAIASSLRSFGSLEVGEIKKIIKGL